MDTGASSYHRYLDGEDEGIAEIVNEYKDGLILFLNGFVNNIHIAEDLTEDTFFRLMVKKPTFSGKSSFKSWLYAIGRNVAIDYVRHHARIINIPNQDLESYVKDEENLERTFLREEKRIRMHQALKRISPDYRQVLWLTFFEDMSGKEVGKVMKKNSRQIRNLLYRAKQSLKEELEKEDFDYEDF